jgi:hypothetical protein
LSFLLLSFLLLSFVLSPWGSYEHGIGGVALDFETASQYSLFPAEVASNAYHTVGAQPLIETDRIDDNTEANVSQLFSLVLCLFY